LTDSGMRPYSPVMLLAQDQAQSPSDSAAPQMPKDGSGAEPLGFSDDIILKSGTEVKLVFAQSVSSKHAAKGEKVELRVAEDIRVDHMVVVPAGARVLGTVVQGKKNEKYGNSKDLAVSVDYIAVKGKRIKLTGERKQKPQTNVGSATAATIGFGLTGLMVYMSQREAWIREGTPANGYVAEDVIFTRSELSSAAKVGD